MKQVELSVLAYGDMFAWLQDKCGLEDDEEHDLINFLRDLRTDIVESMNDCTTIHEAHIGKQFVWSGCLKSRNT